MTPEPAPRQPPGFTRIGLPGRLVHFGATKAIRGRRNRVATLLPLLSCFGLDAEGMDGSSQLLSKHLVHHAVALDCFHTLEFVRDDDDLKVRLRAFRDAVLVTLVVDLQVRGLQRRCQFLGDGRLHGADVSIGRSAHLHGPGEPGGQGTRRERRSQSVAEVGTACDHALGGHCGPDFESARVGSSQY